MPPSTDNLPVLRTRAGLLAVSLGVIALELAMMRMLSLRFWSHFAYMVISVAILGFGASGTAITLMRRWIVPAKRAWMFGLSLAMAVSIPLILIAARALPLDVQFLVWDLRQVGTVALLELLMLIPFLLGGMFVGIALMDLPERVGGHYAWNLIGSGLGAVGAIAGMYVLTSSALGFAGAVAAFLGGVVLIPRGRAGIAAVALAGAGLILSAGGVLRSPGMSQYKMLPQVLATPGTETIHQTEGPLGRIDVVRGPAIHFAPGLSLQYTDPIPPHVLLIVDGDQTSAVYDCRRRTDWAFADQTTAAVAYHLSSRPSVCVLGTGGGVDVGLAMYHRARKVVALEMNRQIIDTMTGALRELGGDIYRHPNVTVVCREGREYLTAGGECFDIIQFPAIDAFGASGAGLYAAQESYLYTVEAFSGMWDRLSDDGFLAVTRWARTPPRDGLKIFDTAAEMLHRKGADPARHLAMIRSWATVTVVVSKRPLDASGAGSIREFCNKRSFDLCYLPDLNEKETNRFHILDRPLYFEACRALLGPQRNGYLDEYLFHINAATDDRPYFFHFFRWRAVAILRAQLGRRFRAFVEAGYLMLIAGLIQGTALGAVMILIPLGPGIRSLRNVRGRIVTLGYFLAIGAGFMLLEMGFLQQLIRYLGHPIYSAGVVIASFLIFAGLGSLISRYWRGTPRGVGACAGVSVALLGLLYILVADSWLNLTQTSPIAARFAIAACTIAPLGFAMGHMLPTGIRQITLSGGPLVPWGWAINGFASVVATVAAPLLAMDIGFTGVTLIAAGCYLAAGGLSLALPTPSRGVC